MLTTSIDRGPDLPNINHSPSTTGWRLLNCFGFAAVTVFLLLPPLLLPAQPGAVWDSFKLHLLASGTTFSVALGLALFALRRSMQS
jgi:predicted cobalt transporter CbtA